MLVELNVVEQRYQAVLEVLNDGISVAEVAARAGVTRQTVHRWLRRYAADGLAGLVDQSTVPVSCPHQMGPVVEARIVALREEHPGWGPRTLGHQLGKEGFVPVPVGLGNSVVPGQAAFSYSLTRPSHRAVRSSVTLAGTDGGWLSAASGGRCSRERCGRCLL